MNFNNIFFIGVAGTGMSALAQYLAGAGKKVSGSDRYFEQGKAADIREKLEQEGVQCYFQDGSGIGRDTDLVVVSAAIEETVPEVVKARQLKIPVMKRSELLAEICKSKKTIAVAGTSGKSTTSAMLFDILKEAGMEPGIISGAGLTALIREGKIGNAKLGKGEWLIIEADESDGSVVQYHPEIGLLLNIDKDHQEIEELISLFTVFRNNTKGLFIVNRGNPLTRDLSLNGQQDFSIFPEHPAGFMAVDFAQKGMHIHFSVNGQPFTLHTLGKHNMENALAAIAAAVQIGIPLSVCSKALEKYEGIYRRHQYMGEKNGVHLIDDYAHNPVKCASSIRAVQPVAGKVIAWFQPHGYGPTRFLKDDFIREIADALRPQDEIWMSEIFYAGGSAVKDISSNDLVEGIRARGKNAFFVADRNELAANIRPHLEKDCVVLLMGARDPGLEAFGKQFLESI